MGEEMRGYKDSKTPPEIRDSLETPQFVFDYADLVYGPFDIDLACTTKNAKTGLGCFIDKGVSAFDHDFSRYTCRMQRAWCNPPYSDIPAWLRLADRIAADDGISTCMLIPTPNGDAWQDYCIEVCKMHFITGRIAFIDPYAGKPKPGNNRGSMFCLIGPGWNAYLPVTTVSRKRMQATGKTETI